MRTLRRLLGSFLTLAVSLGRISAADEMPASDQKAILDNFYQAAGGSAWTEKYGWTDTTVDICERTGITCDTEGYVTDISLNDNGLSGAIHYEIWYLPRLYYFSATDNQLSNAGFYGMNAENYECKIQIIDLSTNILTDINDIQYAPHSLRFLLLTENKIYGTIPTELFDLVNLRKLHMSFNKLQGTIPSTISKFTALKELYLYGNELTGSIPTQLGELKNLEILTLAENLMSGPIPQEVNNLENIQTFSVHNNLKGSGSHVGTIPTFDNCRFLTTLLLDGNDLTGNIPSLLLHHATKVEDAVTIGLSDNQLTGPVPWQLTRFDNLFLDIVGNNLDELSSVFCVKDQWMNGLVEKYGCDAIACPPGTHNQKAGRQETDDDEDKCSVCETDGTDEISLPNIGSYLCPEEDNTIKKIELRAMAILFVSTSPEKWKNTEGWDVFDDVGNDDEYYDIHIDEIDGYCNFHGITCNADNRITEIDLVSNGLHGEIPSAVLELGELKVLDLSYNDVFFPEGFEDNDSKPSHGFEGVEKAKKLEELDMSGTATKNLNGIKGVASTLKRLKLNNIKLEDTSHSELLELVNLVELDAIYAGLSGNLGTGIGNLKELTRLILYKNDLDGAIPTEIGDLTKLTILDLSENKFDGTLPAEVDKLINLTTLSIHHRESPGIGLTGAIPSLSSLVNLENLYLDSNKFSGPLPSTFLSGLSATSSSDMKIIDLSQNELTGGIPTSLSSVNNLYLRLEDNKINDIGITCADHPTWMRGSVGACASDGGCNECDAILCPIGKYSMFGRAIPSSGIYCTNCGTNDFFGATSCDEADEPENHEERKILISLYRATGGKNWALNSKWDEDGEDHCDFHGIKCVFGKVEEIVLNTNQLNGNIPTDIWKLSSLKKLQLDDNPITLDFNGIEQATNLIEIDVSDTKTTSFTNINKATKLEVLDISENDIDGTIPTEIYEISTLKELSMNFNHFGGALTPDLEKLPNLERFECESCDLAGTIPSEIGGLSQLKEVLLPMNFLGGRLPEEMNDLKNLEILNLSRQRGTETISGPLIPFNQVTKLTELNLSFNELTGPIPTTFLSGNNAESTIYVNLESNKLTGTVPTELDTKFGSIELNIYLAGNKITKLPTSLCDNAKWMEGEVGSVGSCDAILCSKGTYSTTGIATLSKPCKNCGASASNDFLGQTSCSSGDQDQTEILEEFYEAMNGKFWSNQRNWKSSSSVCTWFGVTCDEEDKVIGIDLNNNNLSHGEEEGSVKIGLFKLPSLRYLSLASNKIDIDLSSETTSDKLESLILASTNLKSLDGIGSFPKLIELSVRNTGLSGSIPDALSSLTDLIYLQISNNDFRGGLIGITDLKNLRELYAEGNHFTGQIPVGFGSFSNLETLDLSNNDLGGTLPNVLNSLINLRQLSLQDQSFEGKLLNFKSITSLEILELQNNQFTGEIPSDLLSGFADKTEDILINLDFNELSGTVPASLKAFTRLDLQIVGNRLQDFPDDFCTDGSIDNWMEGYVGRYKCNAIACPVGTYSEKGREDGTNSCKKCTSNLYIGGTVCGENAEGERAILTALYKKLGGHMWKEKVNWLYDSKPLSTWAGVVCEMGLGPDDGGITELDFESNGLVGDIPDVIFELPYLKKLNLKDNDVTISFDNIGKSSTLETLVLSDTGLESVNNISRGKSLKSLHLTNNKLVGTLKGSGILELTNLEYLYISYNAFNGKLPSEISNLTNLKEFYAFDNNFSGAIPAEIANLAQLKDLVLTDNLFSGQLPDQLGKMRSLEIFSVFRGNKSGPKLTGTLPSFDEALSLTTLYLDYNQIEGKIPDNFLAMSNGIEEVTLVGNLLTGGLPTSLDLLTDELWLDVTGNRLDSLDGAFCDNFGWMENLVEQHKCNAILCRPEFANVDGRATKDDGTCHPCPGGADAARYWGSTTCEIQLGEREVLRKLYNECGGTNWKTKTNWNTVENICEWYGISCNSKGKVVGIKLVDNNIKGQIPKEIYQLRFLEEIWMSQNPDISFTFDGVENAVELTQLHLSGCGLTNVDGIGKATSLKSLGLYDNLIAGKFPGELFELYNLQVINLDRNELTGPLPRSFEDWEKIVEISMKDNELTGQVPAFDSLWNLKELLLKNNNIGGEIPTDFLNEIPLNQEVLIDLRDNAITGIVPVELDRFERITIELANNQIIGLSNVLCDNDKWMVDAVASYGCNAILCPPGLYNTNGRQTDGNNACTKCDHHNEFYGQTTCVGPDNKKSSAEHGFGGSLKIAGGFAFVISLFHCIY